MSEQAKTVKAKDVVAGMYNVEFVKDLGSNKKGDKAIYHSSTAKTLTDKGFIKLGKKIAKYVPKTMKE